MYDFYSDHTSPTRWVATAPILIATQEPSRNLRYTCSLWEETAELACTFPTPFTNIGHLTIETLHSLARSAMTPAQRPASPAGRT